MQETYPPAQPSGPPNLPEDTPGLRFFRIAPRTRQHRRGSLPNTRYVGLVCDTQTKIFFEMEFNPERGVWEVDDEEEIELEEGDLRVLLTDKGLL